MKKSTILILFITSVFLFPVILTAQISMDPDTYFETAQSTADITRVIDSFNKYIKYNDPVFMLYGDVNFPAEKGVLPSWAGDLSGTFQGFDAFMYLRLFRNEMFTARLFGTWSNLAFALDDESVAAVPFGFSEDETTGWITGYALFGTQLSVGTDRYTLGAILRYDPVIDTGLPSVFSYLYDDEGEFQTTDMKFDRLYADLSIAGWEFDTLLSMEEGERIAAAKLFDLALSGVAFGPAVKYLGRIKSFRPGLEVEWTPLEWLNTRLAASASIAGGSLGFGDAELDIYLPFAINDLFLEVYAGASLMESDGEMVPGGKMELTLDNLRGITVWDWLGLADVSLGASAGLSWNHTAALARMPFEDQLLFYFRIQAAVYSNRV